MIPTPGRIVAYTLTEQDAGQINKRRWDAHLSKIASEESGVVVHHGNVVAEGDVYPMIITRAWYATEDSPVNGQVLLDGNDTLWVTSRNQDLDVDGDMPASGKWAAYPRQGA